MSRSSPATRSARRLEAPANSGIKALAEIAEKIQIRPDRQQTPLGPLSCGRVSHCGPPTAPSSIASASFAAALVEAGKPSAQRQSPHPEISLPNLLQRVPLQPPQVLSSPLERPLGLCHRRAAEESDDSQTNILKQPGKRSSCRCSKDLIASHSRG